MSLINQMLKDLDARHESDALNKLNREVRALPAAPKSTLPKVAILAGVLLATAGGVAWFVLHDSAGSVRISAAVAQAPLPAAVPPPPVAVPAAVQESVAPVAAASLSDAAAATPLPADPPAGIAVDETSGLKLAALLDKVPPESAAPRAASRPRPPTPDASKTAMAPTTVPSSPSSASPTPAPASAAAPMARSDAARATETTSRKPAATPVIEKTAPVKSARERAEADYRRAVSLVSGARTTEAVDALLDALQHDGSHVASRQLLARLLIEQRRYDEAMATLAEGLAGQPGQVPWAMMLARLQVDRGDHAAAARTLQGVQSFAGGNADYQGFAGLVAHRLGRHRESATFYQTAARIAPGEGRWWLGLGLALEADQRAAEAREAFQQARASGTLNADLAAIVDQKLR